MQGASKHTRERPPQHGPTSTRRGGWGMRNPERLLESTQIESVQYKQQCGRITNRQEITKIYRSPITLTTETTTNPVGLLQEPKTTTSTKEGDSWRACFHGRAGAGPIGSAPLKRKTQLAAFAGRYTRLPLRQTRAMPRGAFHRASVRRVQ